MVKPYLKSLLAGVCLMFGALLVWILSIQIRDPLYEIFDSDFGFYAGVIGALIVLVTGAAWIVYRRKSVVSPALRLGLLFLPYVLLLGCLSVMSLNLPRLLDFAVIAIGYVLILLFRQRPAFQRWGVISAYGLLVMLGYPPVYESVCYAAQDSGTLVSTPLPESLQVLRTVQGDTLRVQELKGKVVCIDLWSAGCGNCIRDMPKLEKLVSNFAGKDIQILSVYCPRDSAQTFAWYQQYIGNKFSYHIPYYYLDIAQVQKHGITRFPEFILLDRKGIIAFQGLLNYNQSAVGNIYGQLETLLQKP